MPRLSVSNDKEIRRKSNSDTLRNPVVQGFLLFIVISFLTGVGIAQTGEKTEAPLRDDPLETVIKDLETYVPRRMAEENVLGVSVALIRDEQIAWQKGFGLSNSITRDPVAPETVFSVASNGKAIAGYMAVRMVEDGKLSLDRPLNSYLAKPWPPGRPEHDKITLEHVLTHTSGLSNYLQDTNRRLSFTPGEEFSYSGVGFMFLQDVVAETTGESLDETATRLVFEPLEMRSTYFSTPPTKALPYARGHISYGYALIPFGILFLPGFVIVFLLSCGAFRLINGRWTLGPSLIAVSALIPLIVSLVFLWRMAGALTMPVYFAVVFLVSALVWLALTFLVVRLVSKISALDFVKPWSRALLGCLVGLLLLPVLLIATKNLLLPVPDWFPDDGNAASSLRSTSGDLARFLIEFSKSKNLESRLMDEINQPRVKVNDDVSWGLGVGIQHSKQGDSVWHWGSNPGSKSLMVYYPDKGNGIVVLTNSAEGNRITRDIAGRYLGGKAVWSVSD